jgi:hypothetical protein
MKIIATLFNIAALLTIGYLVIDKGMPRNDEWGIIIAFAGASISTLIYIFTQKSTESSFLGLWLQRKKLEEQKKIDQLRTK